MPNSNIQIPKKIQSTILKIQNWGFVTLYLFGYWHLKFGI